MTGPRRAVGAIRPKFLVSGLFCGVQLKPRTKPDRTKRAMSHAVLP
jgi:hypothetical protein